jgi:LacI family transcriptional regulator
MPITMKQIAEKAGIARPTVSRILNNKYFVGNKETQERVLKIARELNYRPNYFARSLKKGKTNCIGLMGGLHIMSFAHDYVTRITNGVETAVDASGRYSLIVFGANYSATYEKSVEMIEKGLVDGLVLTVLAHQVKEFEQKIMPVLRRNNTPFVVVHSLSRELAYNNVGFNSYQGGRLAGAHLAALGYKDVLFMQEEKDSLQDREIFQGFCDALQQHQVPCGPDRAIVPDWKSWDQVFDTAYRTVLALPQLPRALFCASDTLAYGALKALHERGARVPADTALVGFDDERLHPALEPEITTIRHPLEEKGAAAVAMLLDILEGRRDRRQVHRMVLEPQLVVRKTTADPHISTNKHE